MEIFFEDKPHSGQPKKFEDKELEVLGRRSVKTQEELAESLGVTAQQAVSVRLRAMGMKKQGNWVPY